MLKDGKWTTVKARYLVPGDMIRIRAGDFASADVEFLKGEELEIDQSALTGESLPFSKKTGDKVYSGSIVRKGECNAKVIATGKRIYYGKTTELVSVAKPKLHMEEVTAKIVNYLLLIVVVILGGNVSLLLYNKGRSSECNLSHPGADSFHSARCITCNVHRKPGNRVNGDCQEGGLGDQT